MLSTAYAVTWRWGDGSGSGCLSVFTSKKRAQYLRDALADGATMRQYIVEVVPFDSAPATPEEAEQEKKQ